MKRRVWCLAVTWGVAAAVVTLVTAARAAEETPPAETPAATQIGYYQRVLDVAERVDQTNDRLLWGQLTELLPWGVLGLRLDYENRRYDSAYRGHNDVGDAVKPLLVRDPGGGNAAFGMLRINSEGRLQIINAHLSYGALDQVTVYARLPIMKQNASLRLRYEPGTSTRLAVRTVDEFLNYLAKYGRPFPDQHYGTPSWAAGDLEVGAAWAYYQDSIVYLVLQAMLTAPTGRLADADQALRYGLGAQIDFGQGAFGTGVTHAAQFRLPRRMNWLGFWLETGVTYHFTSIRRRPPWNEPQAPVSEELSGFTIDDDRLLDLSGEPKTFRLRPGFSLNGTAAVTAILKYFTVGVGYTYTYHQTPSIEASARVNKFLKASDAFPANDTHDLTGQVGIPLAAFRLPGLLNVMYTYPLGGRNVLRYEDRAAVQTLLALPLF
jgi:hypothetical protein